MRALAAAALAALALVPLARADGDPASDFLIAQSAFLPFDAKIDGARKDDLNALLEASKQAGFPIKVAVIATKVDLGAVPVLYRQPQRYARFLGQELHYWYKQPLLVVMPNGYGIYKDGVVSTAARRTLDSLAPPNTTDGNELVAAADRAVRRLARAHGVPPAKLEVASSSSSSSDRLKIGIAVLAVAALGGLVVLARRRWSGR
jgi:hypothetical protein